MKLERLDLYFLLVFSLSVLVGLRFLGAFLAGSLIIIPATTGRRLTNDLSHFLIVSCLASVAAVGSGLAVTRYVLPQFSPGPVIVIISAMLFVLSFLISPASA